MTESFSWLYDAAIGLNLAPPDTVKAESELKDLVEFTKKCIAS